MIRLLPQPAGRIEGGHVMFDAQDLTTLGRTSCARSEGVTSR
jgi:hypothetical protein